MNRYFSSFIISLVSYIVVIALLIYVANTTNYSDKDVKVENVKKINFSVITPQKPPKPKPKPIQKPKPKPVPKPKLVPKPKPISEPEPKPISEPEPIIEPELISEPEPIIEEEPPQEIQEPIVEEVVEYEEVIKEPKNKINHEVVLVKQNLFIADLINRINSNKFYPNMARRRHIEGSVDVKFTILPNGSVINIEIISGRNIFKRSTMQAISNSFPISIDSSLFDFPKEFQIKILYILK